MKAAGLIFGPALLTCLCIVLMACQRSVDRELAGEVAGQAIYMDEVDDLIKNSLYEYLFAIFDARSIATDELINSRLLEIEAQAQGLTIDSLLAIEMRKIGKVETKSKYIDDNALRGGVVDERRPFELHQLNSETGKKILDDSYRKFLKVQLVEALRAKYGARILIDRPKPPTIRLDDVMVHTRGNVNAKTSITIISDFDCSACNRAYPEFSKVFERYKDRVRFEAASLSSDVTMPVLLSECASEEAEYWNVYDALYKDSRYRTDRASLLKNLALDRKKCIKCIESKSLNNRISTSMAQLRSHGIAVTPTVLINRRIYYGPLESGAIGRFLENLLLRRQNE